MKTKILMAILFSLLVILVVSPGIPAGNKAAERGQGTGRKDAKAPPEIEIVTFANIPYWNSPPWYPPEDETDTYRLVRGGVQWWILSVDCVVYTSEASGAPPGAYAAVTPAFTTWDEQTSASIYGSISEDPMNSPPGIAIDGSNTVCWGTIDGPGGTIAVTQFVFWSNTKELVEFDIKFDSEELWSTTGAEDAFDVQNVMTHELGHTLVLDDLRSPRDGALTMHAYTWPGDSTKRDLGSGDILGIRAIYGD